MTNAEAVNWLINITADIGKAEHSDLWHYEQALSEIREMLEDAQPTVEPQRIKGRWERKESDLSWWYECSECGESPLFDPYENEVLTRFCPWCGARMEEEEDAVD